MNKGKWINLGKFKMKVNELLQLVNPILAKNRVKFHRTALFGVGQQTFLGELPNDALLHLAAEQLQELCKTAQVQIETAQNRISTLEEILNTDPPRPYKERAQPKNELHELKNAVTLHTCDVGTFTDLAEVLEKLLVK